MPRSASLLATFCRATFADWSATPTDHGPTRRYRQRPTRTVDAYALQSGILQTGALTLARCPGNFTRARHPMHVSKEGVAAG